MGKTITWPKAVESIEAAGDKTYYVGDKLDISNLKVIANLDDDSTMQIPSDEFNAIPKIFTSANQPVTVLYRWGDQAFTCEVTGITVNALTVSSVAVKYDFNKKVYKVNEEFDPEGFALQVTYNSGKVDVVADDITFSTPSMSSAGTKTITATYGGKSATSTIEVEDIEVLSLIVKSNPEKIDYQWTDELDTTGAVIEAMFDNSSLEDVTASCSFEFNTGGEMADEGTNAIVVTYEGLEIEIPVTSEPKGQISTPVISIDGNTLSVTNVDENADGYDVWVDGSAEGYISTPTSTFDLATLDLSLGNHVIYAIGWASGYVESEHSNEITYEVFNIVITGLNDDYAVGETVEGISATLEGTETALPYTINGEEVTSYDVTEDDIEGGITVSATYKGVTKTETAGVYVDTGTK